MKEATTDTVLLAAIEQFKGQTTTRVLFAVLEEYYMKTRAGTTQKEDVKKISVKMLPSTHCMCTIRIFAVNARIVKVKNENIIG